MSNDAWIAISSLLFALGALGGYFIASARAARRAESLRAELAATHARLEAESKGHAQLIDELARNEQRLHAAFDQLAGRSLRANSEMFLQLARETFASDQVRAQAALSERESAIAQLVDPIRQALEKTEQQVQLLERERREAFGSMRSQIENLSGGQAQLARETRNLVTALRRPEVRGRWGEITLRRVVELAGMSEHCDFTEQAHATGDTGQTRPDLIVHMPDARDLVVDSKTPLDAYLAAIEADADETARNAALARHARQVEARVRELAAKSYWDQFERSPDFAVLFLPGDQFLSAALAERPELVDDALRQSIIIATPSTLMALLKVVAYGWRQARVAENAALIRELGEELHRRLNSFTGHLSRLGKNLTTAVETYNAAVGSLERKVLPHARRFPELGVTSDAPLQTLEPIEPLARAPAGEDDSPPRTPQ